MMRKTSRLHIFVLIVTILISTYAVPLSAAAFSDTAKLAPDTQAYIEYLSSKGIISGYPDGTFKPNNPVTRSQIAKMVTLALGLQPGSVAVSFADTISLDADTQSYINILASNGIVQGYLQDDGRSLFKPNNPVSRSQIAKIVTKAFGLVAGSGQTTFADITSLDEATRLYINTLADNGIVKGYSQDDGRVLFKPNNPVSRSQFAIILSRALGYGPIDPGDEQAIALSKAEQYNGTSRLSLARLQDQLAHDNFSQDSVNYALNTLKPDWRANALQTAKNYNRIFHLSKNGLYDMLVSASAAQFSQSEAQYAVDNVGANWNENALITARNYRNFFAMSNDQIYKHLTTGDKFTAAEAQYAINNLG